jgi:hypothetical protein
MEFALARMVLAMIVGSVVLWQAKANGDSFACLGYIEAASSIAPDHGGRNP